MSTSQHVEIQANDSGRFHGNLPARCYRFALEIIRLFDEIPSCPKSWVLGRQLLRSGTSVGANVQEASQALTDAEFVQRCSIARKEASETGYWIDLCVAAALLRAESAAPVRAEADELLRILSSIVKRCQLKKRRKQRRDVVCREEVET